MAATDAVFRTSDAGHVRSARAIEAALRPLETLPLPIDDPYR